MVNKCHDVYGKDGVIPVNEKGRLIEPSLCDFYEEKMERIKHQYRRGGKKIKLVKKIKNINQKKEN